MDTLGPKTSLSLARPSVMAYAADPAIYPDAAADVIAAMQAGVSAEIGGEYPLVDAAKAHDDLENGRTTGSLLLL